MANRHQANIVDVEHAALRERLERGAIANEQRVDPRIDADLELDIPLPTWDQVLRVFSKNISQGGLMFTVKRPVKLPGTAHITLTLPDGRAVTLTSEVRHAALIEGTDQVEVGVQFKSMPDDVDEALRDALAELRSRS